MVCLDQSWTQTPYQGRAPGHMGANHKYQAPAERKAWGLFCKSVGTIDFGMYASDRICALVHQRWFVHPIRCPPQIPTKPAYPASKPPSQPCQSKQSAASNSDRIPRAHGPSNPPSQPHPPTTRFQCSKPPSPRAHAPSKTSSRVHPPPPRFH
jgi:hypothetical protein